MVTDLYNSKLDRNQSNFQSLTIQQNRLKVDVCKGVVQSLPTPGSARLTGSEGGCVDEDLLSRRRKSGETKFYKLIDCADSNEVRKYEEI